MTQVGIWATQPKRWSLVFNWHGLFLLVIALPLLLLALDTYPATWFDEGYTMNVANTLAEDGVYGSHSIDGYIPFDPGMTSGPLTVVGTALSFKLFGVGIVQARLLSVVLSLVGLFGLLQIASLLFGPEAGLFTVLFALIPTVDGIGFLSLGRQVLGEPAALAMITLGLWLWFVSWGQTRKGLSVVAGGLIALGILSKMQLAAALLPTLVVITVLRALQRRSQLVNDSMLLVTIIGVVGLWQLLGQLVTPPDVRAANSQLLFESIQIHVLAGLYGRSYSLYTIIFTLILVVGILAGLRLLPRLRYTRYTDVDWAKAVIILFLFFFSAWFALLSIGWSRYTYIGLCFSLLLFGKLVWDMVNRLPTRVYPYILCGLALVVIVVNSLPALRSDKTNYSAQTAAYIETQIPQDAVIETWEWELSGLGVYEHFHHPHQRYLFEAIRQFSHGISVFDLNYDAYQADPDYLIIGTFGSWTHIYDDIEPTDFNQVAAFGPYRILKRLR